MPGVIFLLSHRLYMYILLCIVFSFSFSNRSCTCRWEDVGKETEPLNGHVKINNCVLDIPLHFLLPSLSGKYKKSRAFICCIFLTLCMVLGTFTDCNWEKRARTFIFNNYKMQLEKLQKESWKKHSVEENYRKIIHPYCNFTDAGRCHSMFLSRLSVKFPPTESHIYQMLQIDFILNSLYFELFILNSHKKAWF